MSEGICGLKGMTSCGRTIPHDIMHIQVHIYQIYGIRSVGTQYSTTGKMTSYKSQIMTNACCF